MAKQETENTWKNTGKFTGFQTLYDPSKIDDGASPSGQNTSFNEGDRISCRPYGYEAINDTVGTPADYGGAANISSLHTFNKRGGENILMRALQTITFGSAVQFLDPTTEEWQYLSYGGLNSPYGFADFNIDAQQQSNVYFCNGGTNILSWNGAHGNFASASNGATFIGTVASIPQGIGNLGTDSGYVADDVVTITGGTATATVSSVAFGGINGYTLTDGGSGYSPGDTLLFIGSSGTGGSGAKVTVTSLSNAGTGAQFTVATVDGGGAITGGAFTAAGTGYNVADAILISTGGTGSGAQFTVVSVDSSGGIVGASLLEAGTGYTATDVLHAIGTGTITSLSLANAGSGYIADTTANIANVAYPGGLTASIFITSVDGSGAITGFTLSNGGSRFFPSITYGVSSGSIDTQNGLFEVDTVDGGGTVLTLHQTGRGTGYVLGTTATDISGAGTSAATISVNSIYNGYVSGFSLTTNSAGYGTGVTATTGGTGAGFTVNILTLGSDTLTISGVANLVDLGFPQSGNFVVGDNASPFDPTAVTKYSYGGINGDTFIGVSPDPTAISHTVGDSVFSPATVDPTDPSIAARGNILLTADNRLFVAGDIRNPARVYFSEYGNPSNIGSTVLVNSALFTDPGIFNLVEGGGRVTDLILQENSIYMFKEALIYTATLTDSGYTITPLKPFDGSSRSSGALDGTVFTGSNMVFMATLDNQILGLGRIEFVDYPQNNNISYPILPTVKGYNIQRLRGISYNNRVLMSVSSGGNQGLTLSSDETLFLGQLNDRVLIWNVNTKQWDTPIVGWNVSCWAIYDANDGQGPRLYFGSDVDPNVYGVTTTPTDGDFDVSASWLSKRYDFADPTQQKWCSNFFVYGRILPSTTLTVKVYFNEEGSTQTYTGSFVGTDTDNLFGLTDNNAFGENPFGIQTFGDQADSTGMRYFRVYFVNKVRAVPFYNIQIGFSSDGQNQQWEVLDFAFETGPYQNPENRNLYADFTPAPK